MQLTNRCFSQSDLTCLVTYHIWANIKVIALGYDCISLCDSSFIMTMPNSNKEQPQVISENRY